MSKEPVVITVDLDSDKSIRDQLDTPENREAIAGVVRDAIGQPPPGDGFWADAPSGPAEPIAFQTARKDLLHALTRTQHALSGDEAQRAVEALVHEARHEGKPIISDGDGYRLTDDPEEVATMAARLHRRSTHVHETAQALEATAERMAREQAGIRAGTLWGQP